MKRTLLIFLLFYGVVVFGSETSLFYVTDDGFLVYKSHKQITLNPQKVEEAKKSKESLPAAAYPEGNWGNVQNGFQLSMRLKKISFTNGEPIVATILLRNVTNQILSYPLINIAGRDGPIGLVIVDDKGNDILPESDDITIISAHESSIFPGTQKKFVELLNQTSAFKTNKNYSVYAHIRVSCPHCVELDSAKVPIKIE
ncbi:MAG TPA: hypothetical protein VMH87_17365 [Pseudomonadales bacterium]|nr:hypothetical protein [Pseudomonadales bacterium]